MQHTFTRAVAILLLALFISTPAATKGTQNGTEAKCQSAKDRIERYTAQRRRGGSAGQMQKWKEQLRASEEQFRRLECKNLRRKLR